VASSNAITNVPCELGLGNCSRRSVPATLYRRAWLCRQMLWLLWRQVWLSPQDYHRVIATNAAHRVHPRTTDEIRSEPALALQAVMGLAS
jgi:hypothetical protein